MAWITEHSSGSSWISQRPDSGQTDFYTWRDVEGLIQMRLTDVTLDSRSTFSCFSMDVQLLSADGHPHAHGTLIKRWGVSSDYIVLGTIAVRTPVRLRIVHSSADALAQPYTFTFGIRWRTT